MAGTYYPTATGVAERVTLTTSTNEKCAAYHSRIPLLVKLEQFPTASMPTPMN
jgi:hypothetical protein